MTLEALDMRDLRDDGGDPGMVVGEEPKVGLDVNLVVELDKMAKRCVMRRGLMAARFAQR